jgi:hypothetical protein
MSRSERAAGAVLSAEWGRYEGSRWVTLHPMRRERLESEGAPVTLLEPGVARVILNLEEQAISPSAGVIQ